MSRVGFAWEGRGSPHPSACLRRVRSLLRRRRRARFAFLAVAEHPEPPWLSRHRVTSPLVAYPMRSSTVGRVEGGGGEGWVPELPPARGREVVVVLERERVAGRQVVADGTPAYPAGQPPVPQRPLHGLVTRAVHVRALQAPALSPRHKEGAPRFSGCPRSFRYAHGIKIPPLLRGFARRRCTCASSTAAA